MTPVPSDPVPPSAPRPPTLRRELRAVLVLYVVVSLVPLALGWLLAG